MTKGQGATEYLVLLAVVLIIALVSIALLGFFPGLSSDAQATESRSYWMSAYPLAIVEWDAMGKTTTGVTTPYIRVKNIGNYPITITNILGGNQSISQLSGGMSIEQISLYGLLAPGEERMYYSSLHSGSTLTKYFSVNLTGSSSASTLAAADSICSTSGPNYGYLRIDSFGFKYTTTIENTQVTKTQIGSIPVIIKCSGAG